VPARALALVVGAGALVCAWLAVGPAQLGGPVSYAIVSGSSMEPHLHRGDLVVVSPAARYEVGDVVAYRIASGATILHRIIGTTGDRFVLRGDANTWTDPYEPARRHIVGRLDHRLPGVGRALEWLRSPLPMSLTVGVVSFLVGARFTRRVAV
jgi:signal peptidase I